MCQRRLVNQKKKLKTTRRPAPPYHNGLTCTGATAERAAMTARTKVVTLCGGRFAVKAPCVTRIAEPAWRSWVNEALSVGGSAVCIHHLPPEPSGDALREIRINAARPRQPVGDAVVVWAAGAGRLRLPRGLVRSGCVHQARR